MVALTISMKTQAQGKITLRAEGLCHPFQEIGLQKQEAFLLGMTLGFFHGALSSC